jgi:hypothetical protein
MPVNLRRIQHAPASEGQTGNEAAKRRKNAVHGHAVGRLIQQGRKRETAYPVANKKAGTQTLVPALVLAGCPDKLVGINRGLSPSILLL